MLKKLLEKKQRRNRFVTMQRQENWLPYQSANPFSGSPFPYNPDPFPGNQIPYYSDPFLGNQSPYYPNSYERNLSIQHPGLYQTPPFMNGVNNYSAQMNPAFHMQPFWAPGHVQDYPYAALVPNMNQGYGQPFPQAMYQSGKEEINPFENPLYLKDEDFHKTQAQPYEYMNITHPYPKQNLLQKNSGGNFSSVLNQFKTQEGSIDFNKMVDTAGQMLNSVNQVTNLVKGVGSIFKPGS